MIPLYKSYWDESDLAGIKESIQRGTGWAEGPNIELFETAICEHLKLHGALICNSGTSALHLAMMACGVRWRHEVIVPSFTFIATANAVRFVGATPVFADIEDKYMGLDPNDVESRITSKTKAIIAVHYAGHPCRIEELRNIANRNKVLLIEDAAEAQGADVNGLMVGEFGDCSILSFCASKIISTGEGGALVTDTKYIYDIAKLLRSHGAEADLRYTQLGYNLRMSDMQAALGISQMAKISKLIQKRRQVAAWYRERLEGVILPPNDKGHVYQLFTIRTPTRDAIMQKLRENDIASKVYFHPVHLTEYYKQNKWEAASLPVTERVSSEVLSLPMYPGLTEGEVDSICSIVNSVVK